MGGRRLSGRYFRGSGTWDIEGLCATVFCTIGNLGDCSPGLKKSEASPHLTPETLSRVVWVETGGETLDRADGDIVAS